MSRTPGLPDSLVQELRRTLPAERLLLDPESLYVYQCDALTLMTRRPAAVTLPETTEETAAVVRACAAREVPMTPRGAGTGLSGGAVPPEGGVLIDTSRMKRILEIDEVDRYAVVQPGLVNLDLSQAVDELGLFYAPDPSSQTVCTIGGNIAENSGGPHCLKYGATTAHILGLTVVLEDGEVVTLGGPVEGGPSLDLVGALVGSEGTLAIVTEAVVRLTRKPDAVMTLLGSFESLPDACRAVSQMIAAGISASAIEALDQLTIEAVEASVYAAGYPKEAGAVLLVELDGHPLDLEHDRDRIDAIFRRNGCLSFDTAGDPVKRKELWQGRKGAFGAMGRLAPDLYVMDTVVPRSRLEEAIVAITAICERWDIRLANVFHAGEGNLHPNICYDGRNEGEVERVLKANAEIVETCLRLGGALSGEHGIGLEKQEFMPLLFDATDLDVFHRFRRALCPRGLLNPGKMLPTPRACTEVKGDIARIHARTGES